MSFLTSYSQAARPINEQRLEVSVGRVKKIIDLISRGDHSGAGIRISQARLSKFFPVFTALAHSLTKDFNPSEARDARGRWTNGHQGSALRPRQAAVIDPYCKIVKHLCIVEATETLPTRDFGVSFQRALNSCMDRHGCLGKA